MPLSDLTVLDLGPGVAAPFAGKLLADYGADVVRVEPPGRGDETRGSGPFPLDRPNREASALFLWLNGNKRGVTLDIASATGRRLLREMATHVDVVLEGFAPGHLDRLGLGWSVLSKANPRLVMASVTPFGQDGPYARWRGTALTAFAMGGQMSLTGDPDREPLLVAGRQAEYQAGLNAFGAVLAAMVSTAQREVGQHVDISAMECQASILELYLPDVAYRKAPSSRILCQRRGNINSATIGLYAAADGYVGIQIMPRTFPRLARTMDAEWLIDDPRFQDMRGRLQHNDELTALIAGWAADRSREEIYHRAGRELAPIAYIHTLEDLYRSPQLQARDYLRRVDHPGAGAQTHPGPPFRTPDQAGAPGPAPLLGQHNAEVYGEWLGLSRRDLVRLRQAGVI